MSNFLAIATVTATLSQTIRAALAGDVPGADVSAARPDRKGEHMPETGVNLFLYQVTPNAAWSNADLPTRGSDGRLLQRPQAAMDLHYLLSFYGDELQLEPQRLLGSTVRALNAKPVLTRKMIQDTLANPSYSYLGGSNLSEAIELVKFTPLPLTLEELSKLWSIFFRTPYTLSITYQGTVVLIETEETPQAALPVRKRDVYVVPFGQPVIDRVESLAGPGQPILADSTLVIRGKRLRGEVTKLRLDGIERTPAPEDVSDTRISLPLGRQLVSPPQPALLLPAGVHGAQVVHMIRMGSPPQPHRGVESNVVAFVLCPVIERDPDTRMYQIAVSDAKTNEDGTRTAKITAGIRPAVGKRQRVELCLNEFNSPSDRPSRAYTFEARSSDQPVPQDDTFEEVVFSVSRVRAGAYLVRVRVDGAESPLEADQAGLFTSPQVTIG